MRYCGGSTCHGHGDYAICGQPYINGIYQCPSCELADLKETKVNLFSPEYAALQSQFHIDRPDYGCSGSHYADQILQMANAMHTRDLLDYGAGKCTLQKALPFPIQNYDPFIPELCAVPPSPADLVICTDVMEHVEDECILNVLRDIHDLTKQAAFFQIATTPAKKMLPDGRNAHISLHDLNWWLRALMTYFDIKSVMNIGHGFVAVVSPIAEGTVSPKDE